MTTGGRVRVMTNGSDVQASWHDAGDRNSLIEPDRPVLLGKRVLFFY